MWANRGFLVFPGNLRARVKVRFMYACFVLAIHCLYRQSMDCRNLRFSHHVNLESSLARSPHRHIRLSVVSYVSLYAFMKYISFTELAAADRILIKLINV